MDSYLVKPRIYMDRDGLTEILQAVKKHLSLQTGSCMKVERSPILQISVQEWVWKLPSFQRSSRIRILQL